MAENKKPSGGIRTVCLFQTGSQPLACFLRAPTICAGIVGDFGMILAIGRTGLGFMATEMEICITRVTDWPFAGIFRQGEDRRALGNRHDDRIRLGIFDRSRLGSRLWLGFDLESRCSYAWRSG